MKMKEELVNQIEEVNKLLEKLNILIDQAREVDENLYQMTVFSLERMTENLEEFLDVIKKED